MVKQVDARKGSFVASGALTRFARVRLDGSFELALCIASSTDCLGVVEAETFNQGDVVSVIFLNKEGTIPMIANAAITRGVEVFAAAAGKIAPAGTVSVGEALEAATADNDEIEVFPLAQ